LVAHIDGEVARASHIVQIRKPELTGAPPLWRGGPVLTPCRATKASDEERRHHSNLTYTLKYIEINRSCEGWSFCSVLRLRLCSLLMMSHAAEFDGFVFGSNKIWQETGGDGKRSRAILVSCHISHFLRWSV